MVSLEEVVVVAALAGCATGIGAFPAVVADRVSHRLYDGALGLAAGIMIGAAVFALVLPGLDLGSVAEVTVGLLAGGLFLLVANALVPHVHEEFDSEEQEGTIAVSSHDERDPLSIENGDDLRKAILVGAAVTIHNVPEGLAVGIAFASGEEGVAIGTALAVAIAVQNVPDGFAMAVPAARAGVSNLKTLVLTTASGAVPETIAAAVGFGLVAVVTDIFPLAAGFAAGAMIAVVFRELIPSSHGHGYADTATATFVLGFATMLVVDTILAVG